MGPTAAPETPSVNLPYTPCKNTKTKNQYSFHGESLKSRLSCFSKGSLLFLKGGDNSLEFPRAEIEIDLERESRSLIVEDVIAFESAS